MVQMVFFLRFRSQLQRIRPEIIPHLENAAVRAVKDAGGKITADRTQMRAVFDENSLGFWLDILLLIETLTQILEEAAGDLHGYSLLVGKTLPDPAISLCRSLSSGKGGVFLDKTATEAMSPYITVEDQGDWTAVTNRYGAGYFSRLKEIKIFVPTARLEFPLSKSTNGLPDPGQRPVVLVASQSFEGKRDKLYFRIADYTGGGNLDSASQRFDDSRREAANSGDNAASPDTGEFYPLFVRFGSGGFNALIDSWADWMKKGTSSDHPRTAGRTAGSKSSSQDELYAAWEFLFRQRLRDKPSSFAIRTARRFLKLLLGQYRSRAQAADKTPVIIIENIQSAEQSAADIVIESLRGWQDFVLLGTCTGEISDAGMAKWKLLFPQLTRINIDEASLELPNLPLDLWEIGYACSLFGRYFPSDLIPQLFEESGKSPLVVSRALSLLYALRVIDTPLDPRPWHRHFQHRAETALGGRKDRIRIMVRSRLLAWVAQKKIDPCLRLLEILKELNETEEIEDSLILQAIHCELTGVDETALEGIRFSWVPEAITGPIRAPILRYILETLIAFHSGNAKNIQNVFASPPPDCSAFPLLRAQVLLNHSLYFMGLRDTDSTAEAVKESSLVFQESGNVCLAQSYRLFALANLLRQRIGETIDYLGFALENAAKSGGFQDIGMAAYYAASVQFLYGNLSRSKILAEKAVRHFLKAGNPEWADRSHFLLGRLAFEIGSYQQAVDIFEDIRQNPEGICSSEKNSLLEAWAYRARICNQLFLGPKPQNGGRDADLFEIEAHCLAGDYSRTVELSGIFSNSPGGNEFLCIEKPDWRSGFTQCELLYCAWNDLRDRMLCAYHSMAQACISPANGEEAMRTMQRVLRSGQSSEIDPYDVFFHYAWYHVLKQAGSSQVDISTAVSVAFKRLQSRAGRIDDMETRRQYLTQPRWNKAIEQAARDFKLV